MIFMPKFNKKMNNNAQEEPYSHAYYSEHNIILTGTSTMTSFRKLSVF